MENNNPTPAPVPVNIIDSQEQSTTAPEATPVLEPQADPTNPSSPKSLMDEINAVNNTGNPDAGQSAPAEPTTDEPEIEITDEAVAEYAKQSGFDFTKDISIGTDALGDGEQYVSADIIKTLTPAIMKLGIPAEKAGAAYQLIAQYEKAQLEHNNKLAITEINARAEASRKEFGKELGEVCRLAAQGGAAIFGDGLWEEMKEVPILVNDKRFLRALAKVGRMLKNDKGTQAKTAVANEPKTFSANAWIKSSSRYS